MYLNNCVLLLALGISIGVLRADAVDSYHYFDDRGVSTTHSSYSGSIICQDIQPQHSVNIEEIRGMWYGNEIIMHSQDIPGEEEYNTCVFVHLADITTQMQGHYNPQQRLHDQNRQNSQPQPYEPNRQQSYGDNSNMRYLRMTWSEKDKNLEYTFNYTTQLPGVWHNVGEQRGSMVSTSQYTQFTGSVQVVKAVNDHLVLTFCGQDVRNTIYSVILSRTEKGLSHEELRGLRNLLTRRGLYTESIRKVCNSGAATLQMSTALLAIFMVMFGVLKKLC